MLEKVKKILSEQLSIAEDKITGDSLLAKDLKVDSLDLVELLMTLEDEFGIAVEDDEVAGIAAVKDIVTFIEGKLAK